MFFLCVNRPVQLGYYIAVGTPDFLTLTINILLYIILIYSILFYSSVFKVIWIFRFTDCSWLLTSHPVCFLKAKIYSIHGLSSVAMWLILYYIILYYIILYYMRYILFIFFSFSSIYKECYNTNSSNLSDGFWIISCFLSFFLAHRVSFMSPQYA